jgi:long-chain acyl-CoA synthetase
MIDHLETYTLRTLLDSSFDKHGNQDAIGAVGEAAISYSDLYERILDTTRRLLSHGIGKGDRVALLGDNSPNWVIAYLSITYMGAVAVPILPGFPEMDTRHIIRSSECVAIFISSRYVNKIEEMDRSPLRLQFDLDTFEIISQRSKTHSDKDKKRDAATDIPRASAEDLAVIIYTSGTTGHSKGVMLTHNNIVSDVINSIQQFPIDTKDRFLSILPLSHTFEATGGMLCPLTAGSSIFYMDGLPTPQKLLSAMATVQPTAVLTVPLVMDKIYRKRVLPQLHKSPVLRHARRIPLLRRQLHRMAGKKLLKSFGGKLRFFMFGGAALNRDVELFLREANISYSTGYGMTETSPILTINPFGRVKIGSCGQPIPGIEMEIRDPEAESGIGEIIVRGPIVMQGYYKNPEATQEVLLPDGWMGTGDLGFFDTEGYLFIKGRSKNVIIGPSGENIYPEIIEQEIIKSPYIQEAVVYRHQDKLIAKVYLEYDFLDQEFETQGTETNKEEAIRSILQSERQKINASLPDFSKIHKMIEFPEPFEKTPTNKVKRYLYIPSENHS